jgi:hypothetical protein
MNIRNLTILSFVFFSQALWAQPTKSLEDRISELEANQVTDIFTFGGYLSTRYDDISLAQTWPTSLEGHTQHWRLTSGLNVNANVSKNFNSWNNQSSGVGSSPTYLTDPADSRAERGSQIYLEKAYANYLFSPRATFSFGRLPTLDGPPTEMPLGNARMGTYPSIGFNAPFDGFALSYDQPLEKNNFTARALYTPFTYYTAGAGKLAPSAPDALGNVTIANTKINSETPFGAIMLEYEINESSVANKINIIAQAYQTGNLAVDGSQYSVGNSVGVGLVEFKVGGQVLSLYLSGVGGSDLDINLTYLQSRVDNSGVITGLPTGSIYGFGASAQGEALIGTTKLLSVRYKLNNTFLGAEYLDGGKNVFNYDPSTEVINGFYSTTGMGLHYYVTQKLTPELSLRVGYMNQIYKSTPFTFGPSVDTDRKISTIYSSLRLDF